MLLEGLRRSGRRCVGPKIEDGAIVYDTLHSVNELPRCAHAGLGREGESLAPAVDMAVAPVVAAIRRDIDYFRQVMRGGANKKRPAGRRVIIVIVDVVVVSKPELSLLSAPTAAH